MLQGFKSPSAKRAWIEMMSESEQNWYVVSSPSAKRAWIEIFLGCLLFDFIKVALCEEGVDRNFPRLSVLPAAIVALCEEGVDRNVLC